MPDNLQQLSMLDQWASGTGRVFRSTKQLQEIAGATGSRSTISVAVLEVQEARRAAVDAGAVDDFETFP